MINDVKRYENEQGQLHREDGPAYERYDGYKEWWINGLRHRLNGSAIEWSDGRKEWWVNGNRHRLDGPAVEWRNGSKSWWVDGQRYSKNNFPKAVVMFLLNCDEETATIILELITNF
jgi:hypothetical protein